MVEVCMLSLCVVRELQQHSPSLLLVAGTPVWPSSPSPSSQLGELAVCDPCSFPQIGKSLDTLD